MKARIASMPGSLRVCAAALGFSLLSTSFALATPGTDAQRAACTPDVFRLCSSDIPNVTRIVACLKREKSRLSPACQQVFNTQTPPAATTASATRSLGASGEEDPCAFQDPQHPSQKDWHGWCGPAASTR